MNISSTSATQPKAMKSLMKCTKHHAPTSKIRRDLDRVIGTWDRDHCVLLLRLLRLRLTVLNILRDIRLVLSLLICVLLLARGRRLTTLLRWLTRNVSLTLSVHRRCLLLSRLRRSQRDLNVRSRNC